MGTFKEYLLNEAITLDSKEGKGILTKAKKFFKDDKEHSAEKIYDAEETIYNGKPGIIIYFYASSNGASSSISMGCREIGYNTEYLDKSKSYKHPVEGIYKTISSRSSFSRDIKIKIGGVFIEFKSSISANQIVELLNSEFTPTINGNTITLDYDKKSDEDKIKNLLSKYKNVSVEFGGYYADNDNKHFVSVATIVVK